MRIHPICTFCLLNRVYYEAKLVTNDLNIIDKCIDVALEILSKKYREKPINSYLATEIHRKVYEILSCDPYKEKKKIANEISAKILPFAEKIVEKSDDRFKAAVKASIIGNEFDFGVFGHKIEEDFERYFLRRIKEDLALDDVERIKELAEGEVIYITDNAGEIFFDTILMKEVKKICSNLTVIVKSKPILSDATVEDAKIAGVDKIADEILAISNSIGIITEELSEEILEKLENSNLIIAKGMANYESLSEKNFKPIAFLLTAKCEPVALSLGVKVKDMVAKVIE